VRAVDRVPSGSPETLVLRPAGDPANVPAAALALARRGVSMLRAKRAIEAMLDSGEALLQVPQVESVQTLSKELKAAGVRLGRIPAEGDVDVRALRQRLNMTQEQFALRYNLDLDAVQNWEQGRRQMDRTAHSYLRVIEKESKAAARALEEPCP
jgi:putative transcriptional regulator